MGWVRATRKVRRAYQLVTHILVELLTFPPLHAPTFRRSPVFARVWSEVDRIVAALNAQLLKQLDDPWAPLDAQEKVIGYLLDLDSQVDPVWHYLESQFRWIVGLLQDAYQEYVSRLERRLKKRGDIQQMSRIRGRHGLTFAASLRRPAEPKSSAPAGKHRPRRCPALPPLP